MGQMLEQLRQVFITLKAVDRSWISYFTASACIPCRCRAVAWRTPQITWSSTKQNTVELTVYMCSNRPFHPPLYFRAAWNDLTTPYTIVATSNHLNTEALELMENARLVQYVLCIYKLKRAARRQGGSRCFP